MNPKGPVGGDVSRVCSFEEGSGPSDLSLRQSAWGSITTHLCAGLSWGVRRPGLSKDTRPACRVSTSSNRRGRCDRAPGGPAASRASGAPGLLWQLGSPWGTRGLTHPDAGGCRACGEEGSLKTARALRGVLCQRPGSAGTPVPFIHCVMLPHRRGRGRGPALLQPLFSGRPDAAANIWAQQDVQVTEYSNLWFFICKRNTFKELLP